LISVQAVELLWVVFVYSGIEHVTYAGGKVHLGFLPYSHSIGSGLIVAFAAWMMISFGWKRRDVAIAVALGVMSHIALDIIQHEPDIRLLPADIGPRLGFGLHQWPLANLIVELLFGVACWFIFRGTTALLVAIVLLNLADAPLMFPREGSATMLEQHPAVLPTVILVQIVITWLAIWAFSRKRRALSSVAP
jgi:hypothetical protein